MKAGRRQAGEQAGWAQSDHNSGGRGQAALVPCIRNTEHTRVRPKGLYRRPEHTLLLPSGLVPAPFRLSPHVFLSLCSVSIARALARSVCWTFVALDGGSRGTPTQSLRISVVYTLACKSFIYLSYRCVNVTGCFTDVSIFRSVYNSYIERRVFPLFVFNVK